MIIAKPTRHPLLARSLDSCKAFGMESLLQAEACVADFVANAWQNVSQHMHVIPKIYEPPTWQFYQGGHAT